MSKKEVKSESAARPYGNYLSAVQDEESGLWYGVVHTSPGESGTETELHRSTSGFRSEDDAIDNIASWCRDRGYGYQLS